MRHFMYLLQPRKCIQIYDITKFDRNIAPSQIFYCSSNLYAYYCYFTQELAVGNAQRTVASSIDTAIYWTPACECWLSIYNAHVGPAQSVFGWKVWRS